MSPRATSRFAVTRLVHLPAVAVAAAAAAALVAVALSVGFSFQGSVGDASVQRRLAAEDPFVGGLTVTTTGLANKEVFENATTALTDIAAPLPFADSPRVTGYGTPRVVAVRGGGQTQIRLFLGTNALDHVEKLEGTGDRGLWLSDRVSDAVGGLHAGDTVDITSSGRVLHVPIAGIYLDLTRDPDRDEYWQPLSYQIKPPPPAEIPLPAFAIADEDTFLDLARRMSYPVAFRWEFPLARRDLSLAAARDSADQVRRVEAAAKSPSTDVGRSLRALQGGEAFAEVSSGLVSLTDDASSVHARLSPSIAFVAFAAAAVALAAVVAAGIFNPSRRRVEVRLLVTHGIGPARQGARAALEGLLPIVLGSGAGAVAGSQAVERLGPSTLWKPDPMTIAVVAAVAAALSLLVFAIATAVEIARRSEAFSGNPLQGRVRWDLVAAALAVASGYEVVGRSSTGGATEDVLALAFPLFATLAVVALSIRVWKRLSPRVERHLPRRPAWHLGIARLTNLRSAEVGVFALIALASGLILYSAGASRSGTATAEAKAKVATGSDVKATLGSAEVGRVPFPTTRVLRGSADWLPEETTVDVLGIDPETFSSAAFWDDSFASRDLSDLLKELQSRTKPLPVVISGITAPADATLSFADVDVPVTVIETATALPGLDQHPVVMVDRDALATYSQGPRYGDPLQGGHELWIKGDPEEITSTLAGNDGVITMTRSDRSAASALVQEQRWIFGLLQAFGICLAVLAIGALIAYGDLDRRGRQVWYVLARRMSMTRATHLASLALELSGLVLVAVAAGGAVGLGSAWLLNSVRDPLPSAPPPPLFRVPGAPIALILLATLAFVGVAAVRGHRIADSVDAASLMRSGE